MKRIGLIVHGGREDTTSCALRALTLFSQAGIETLAEADAPERLLCSGAKLLTEDAPLDAIVALGGDGTLLRAVRRGSPEGVPVLGINLGHVGFLTETGPEALEAAIEQMLAGRYTIDERTMLRATREKTGERYLALNDVVVTRGGYARLITLDCMAGEEKAGSYVADGIVVTTPTGSTGYSLSAGGPILHPAVDCMGVTPVCAHSLNSRPIVVPGSETITLRLRCGGTNVAALQVDGQNLADLDGNETIRISRAPVKARLMRLREMRFFQLVREKLTEWSS